MPEMLPAAQVLVVDDEPVSRLILGHMLRKLGCEVHEADGVAAAAAVLLRTRIDLIVADYLLGDGTGVDLLTASGPGTAAVPFVLVTGIGDDSRPRAADLHSVDKCLTKPVGSRELELCLTQFLAPDAVRPAGSGR